ncbi:MAG: DUF465 domain-containing protein [Pseudomonadota bacterium]
MQDNQDEVKRRMMLGRLRLEHGDLDMAISAMAAQRCDPLSIQRLKKRKLELKDRIEKLASSIIPDATA